MVEENASQSSGWGSSSSCASALRQVFAIEMSGEAAAHFLYLQVQIVAQLILVGGSAVVV